MKVENAGPAKAAVSVHRGGKTAPADAAAAKPGAGAEGDFAALVDQIADAMTQAPGAPSAPSATPDGKAALADIVPVDPAAKQTAANADALALADPAPATRPAGTADWRVPRIEGAPVRDPAGPGDSPDTGESVDIGMVVQGSAPAATDTNVIKSAKPGAPLRAPAPKTEAAAEAVPNAETAPKAPAEADTKPHEPAHAKADKADKADQPTAQTQAQIDAQAAPVAAAVAAASITAAPLPVAAPATPLAPAGRSSAPIAAVTADPAAVQAAQDPGRNKPDADADSASGRGAFARTDRSTRRPDKLDMPASTEGGDDAQQASDTAASLRDIVQSLPPVVQSQLPVADSAPANAVPTVSAAQQLSNHVVDMGVSGQWIDRMAREIASLADGTGHSRFQLSPPNLGRIQVDLFQGDGATHLRMTTETDEAARRLRDGQSMLEADARVAALSLGSVTVEKSGAAFESREQNSGQRQPSDFQQQGAFGQGQSALSQGGNQGGNQGSGHGALNRGGSAAVIEPDRSTGTTETSASRPAERRVRYA